MISQRIEWVDIIRGIAILLVALSHSYLPNPASFIYLYKALALTHVPCFIFVSGFLFSQKSIITTYINNQIFRLLIPFFAYLIIYLPISVFIFNDETDLFIHDSTFISLIKYFSGRTISNMVTGPLWFLPAIFWTQIVYKILSKLCSKYEILLHCTIIGMYAISFIQFYYKTDFWLPLNFHLTFAMILTFHCGVLYKKYPHIIEHKLILFILSLCTLYALLFETDNIINYSDGFYGVPVLSLISSITLIIWLKKICLLLEKYKFISNIFIKLGKSSLSIMAFHSVFILILHKYDIITNPFLLVIISSIISYCLHSLCQKFKITKFLFIGDKNAFK